jgi:aminoglycoside 3-N-acetyltransferase
MKRIIRKILRIRKNETVADGVSRHISQIKKLFYKKKISQNELKSLLSDLGIKNGDTLIVHGSWRNCFMLDMSPSAFIDVLLDLLGDEGTLLMPSFPYKHDKFNVNQDISAAGVLSEVFRNREGTMRSSFPKGTMSGYGKSAREIIDGHRNSIYEYDSKSPYSNAILAHDAKILLVGMGLHPHKISAFHCGSYDAKSNNELLNKTYSKDCTSLITKDDTTFVFKYVDRIPGCRNNKSSFRRLFNKTPHQTITRKGFNAILFRGYDAYTKAYEYCSSGKTLYRYANK